MRRRHICYSGAPPIVLTYLDAKGDSSGSTGAHTYNAAFGAASANRYILVGASITNPSCSKTSGDVPSLFAQARRPTVPASIGAAYGPITRKRAAGSAMIDP